MKKITPTIYQESIYKINYQKLKEKKIKCLLFDLDNTCVPFHINKTPKQLKELMKQLTNQGFLVILFSNSPKKRVDQFKELNIILHPSSRKPFSKKFISILKQYQLKKEEVCIVGDQLFTDILGGNKVGIYTCLVNPLTKEDFILTKITRILEKIMFLKMKKKGILTKGEYYD